jgi:UDP-galactopyranose mutase
MNIICFGQQDWSHCWTGKQQLLTRLARRGHRILYVDPTWSREPRRLPDELRVLVSSRPPGLREVGPGTLFVHRHAFLPSLGWRLNVRMHRVALARLVRALHLPGAVALVMRPGDADRVDAVRPAARVYFAVDEWTEFPGYRAEERLRLRADEEEQLRRAHLALAVSPRLVQRFRELCPRVELLENGSDCEHLAPASLARAAPDPEIAALPGPSGPRIGFIGQVDERLDQELVRALALARPAWQLVLVGRNRPGADLAQLVACLAELAGSRAEVTRLLGVPPERTEVEADEDHPEVVDRAVLRNDASADANVPGVEGADV